MQIEKIKKILNYIANSYIITIIFGLLLLLKTSMFYSNTIALTDKLEFYTIFGTVAFIFAIGCFFAILPNRVRCAITIITNTLISILLFADHIYYTFSSSVISVAQISNIQYGDQITATLPSLLEFKQILYFLDIIIFLILIITKLIKIEKKEKATKKQNIARTVTGVAGLLVVIFICNKYIENGKLKPYNKDLQIRESTIFGYHISDVINTINLKSQAKYKTYKEMQTAYNNLKNKYKEKYSEDNYKFKGIEEDKNIIIIQLESIQDFLVNKKINGKEIMPNLNKFLNDNIRFTNMHMQSYSTTADSEHSVMNSIYPMENGMSFSRYYTNSYDDIYKLYNNKNYFTSYMHGNYPYFWNRGNVYGRLNIDKLEFIQDFEDVSERINGDLSDELLYIQAVDKIKQYENPFMVTVVSASSHTPFTLSGINERDEKVTIDVGKYKDTYFGNYLEAANYADYALGKFFDKLKQEGLYDNTTILLYGDHNGLIMYDEEMLDFLKQLNPDINDVEIKLNYTKVAAGMKLSESGKAVINKPVNKLDIKPTLAYLFNLEDGISIGTNMFESKDFVCLNNGRIITDKYYYDEQWYEIETGNEVDIDNLNEEEKAKLQDYYDSMNAELDLSNSISINDLIEKR